MKTKGFTLLECVIALLLLSLSLLVIPTMIQQSKRINHHVLGRDDQTWHVFLIQLENKLSEGEFSHIKNNKIYFYKFREKTNVPYECQIELNQTKGELVIREDGGYEPILTEVQSLRVIQEVNRVLIEITFLNGEVKKSQWNEPIPIMVAS
ncbi:competence type IV pilus minor pilin ComGF [Candidatus Enterococcus willemsii]|uniref:Prepilin-type N-terminal cleavage/methylation domain-containing protein n=1 Tax=Candidatus Enterococcus willemsii TaxID=1857215 RepID=A0ABQ6YX28_9ENTE|nr:competence type IV pilus minor pilin ComGF [Enterococcus sp. CU12B]KAF1301925.1 prepilin-type N-terminal cleavage/methylation domain-containing protein [Enterococcus sp. CU12B]